MQNDEWKRVQMLACRQWSMHLYILHEFWRFLGTNISVFYALTSALVKGTYYFLCQCNPPLSLNHSFCGEYVFLAIFNCLVCFCIFVFLFFVCLCAYFWYVFFVCTPPLHTLHTTPTDAHTYTDTHGHTHIHTKQYVHTKNNTHAKHTNNTHRDTERKVPEQKFISIQQFRWAINAETFTFECQISNTSNSCAVLWVGCLKPPSRPKQIFSSLKKV